MFFGKGTLILNRFQALVAFNVSLEEELTGSRAELDHELAVKGRQAVHVDGQVGRGSAEKEGQGVILAGLVDHAGSVQHFVAHRPAPGIAVRQGNGLEADDALGRGTDQVDALLQFLGRGGRQAQTLVGGGAAGDVEHSLGHVAAGQQLFQKIGLSAVALDNDLQAALVEPADDFQQVVFLTVRAVGGVDAGNPAVPHVAAHHGGVQFLAGNEPGQDDTGTLQDHSGFRVLEEREFHAFGAAVDGLAVGTVEGVEFLSVFLEVHTCVFEALVVHVGLDRAAADAVRCSVDDEGHFFLSSQMNEKDGEGVRWRLRFPGLAQDEVPPGNGHKGHEEAGQHHAQGKHEGHQLEADVAAGVEVQVQGVFVGEDDVVQAVLEGKVQGPGFNAQSHAELGDGGTEGRGGSQGREQEVEADAHPVGCKAHHAGAQAVEHGQDKVGQPVGGLEGLTGSADAHAAHDEEERSKVDGGEALGVHEAHAGQEGNARDHDEHAACGNAVEAVRGQQDNGENQKEQGALLFIGHGSKGGIGFLHRGADEFLGNADAEGNQDDGHGEGQVEHAGQEVVQGVLKPHGLGVEHLVDQGHAHDEVAGTGQVAELGGAHGHAGGQQDGRCFLALGLELQGVAQGDGNGREDGGLAHDGGHQGGDDGRTNGNAHHGAHEAAARGTDAGQGNALAKAGDSHDLAKDKAAYDNDGHVAEPGTEDDPLLDPAEEDIEDGQKQGHCRVIHGTHGPGAHGPEGHAQEHDHLWLEGGRVAEGRQEEVEKNRQEQGGRPLHDE